MVSSKLLYDIEEYTKKARAALEKLEKTQQPGEVSGKGGKADVVRAIKSDLEGLLKKGYTSRQIADALKHDVFGILPKTITEIVIGKKQSKPAITRKKKSAVQETKAAPKTGTETQIPQAGTFTVKPDSKELD